MWPSCKRCQGACYTDSSQADSNSVCLMAVTSQVQAILPVMRNLQILLLLQSARSLLCADSQPCLNISALQYCWKPGTPACH